MDLKNITGVEIFAAGKWNGDDYTEADLDEMVRAFQEDPQRRPPLKLGHDNGQKLLQKDGYPAAGWVTNLYRSGGKLVADFSDIPSKIYDLIAKRAYRKVSSEVYWDINTNGKTYKRKLGAVSLLGGDMPAVNCLDDILALYGVTNADRVGVYTSPEGMHTLKQYELDAQEAPSMAKTEAEIKLEAERDLEKQKAEKAEKEIADLRQFKLDAEKRAKEDAEKIDAAEKYVAGIKLAAAVSQIEKDYSLSPAVATLVRDLLGPEKKEYALDAKGEKKGDRAELVGQILKLHAENLKVNLKEHSQAGDEADKNKGVEDALNAKIEKYMADNKCKYGDAYVAVLKAEKAK